MFGCEPVPPERDLSGEWLDKATGIDDSHIKGIHLRLPGYGDDGPTLEIFQYDSMPEHPAVNPNTPGFAHIAFLVDDVASTAQAVFRHGGAAVGEPTVREVPGVGSVREIFKPTRRIDNIHILSFSRVNDVSIPFKKSLHMFFT